ncbi:GTP-binding protein [uncultured Shewanella sp.]|uniref:CobW family GTP-binding protein n=1 Tax=uncultured Shewanella sp. TaxID=173975 RepID=UPI002616E3AB|nr:GTP-binding protein [uncultured Shewanella sp.]
MIQTAIPTNIITGFLGVGKTSLIKALFLVKPKEEKWAVLVNEFGDVGIDSALLAKEQQDIHIREVAGGCMCCAAGVPMQVAITQLIAKAKPDRLIIEPTGLGHPAAILKVLTEPHFKHVIAMQACITLVDARKVADTCYRSNETFLQQLTVADIILASKSDEYRHDEFVNLMLFLQEKQLKQSQCLRVSSKVPEESDIETAQLLVLMDNVCHYVTEQRSPSTSQVKPIASKLTLGSQSSSLLSRAIPHYQFPVFDEIDDAKNIVFDHRGIWSKSHFAEAHYSYAWVFVPRYEFDLSLLLKFINSIEAVRVKAILITDEGIVGINWIEGELELSEFDEVMDSRIEIITRKESVVAELELQLFTLLK